MRRAPAAILIVIALILGVVWWRGTTPTIVYLGGPILTMDANDRIVEALAVEDGRIAAVGSAVELRGWAEEHGARIVDLEGRALLPGFIDAHGHYPGAGIYAVHVDLNSPPIGEVETIDDVVAKLTRRAGETRSGEWIVGWGYDDTLLRERRHPTRRDLDRVSSEHPIALWHVSGHLAVLNSTALAALEIGPDTPDPKGGLIRREPGGREPDGVLEEHAMRPVQELLTPGAIAGLRVLMAGGDVYSEAGVTTAQSGVTPVGLFQILDIASRFGLIPVRLMIWLDETAADSVLAGDFQPPDRDASAMARIGS